MNFFIPKDGPAKITILLPRHDGKKPTISSPFKGYQCPLCEAGHKAKKVDKIENKAKV